MRYVGLKRKIRISVGDEAVLKNNPYPEMSRENFVYLRN